MRNQTLDGMTLNYPDEVGFAFSPNFLEVSGNANYTSLSVTMSSGEGIYTFSAAMIGGKARIYISRYLQLLVQNPLKGGNRSGVITVTCEAKSSGSTASFTDFTIVCIWGALDPVKRFYQIGSYIYDPDELAFVRRVRWFKNFPFKASIFATANSLTYFTRYDGNTYGEAITTQGGGYYDLNLSSLFSAAKRRAVIKVQGSTSSVFDDTYDYTFKQLLENTHLFRATVDESKEGHYFRWIDPIGQLQYFLFKASTETDKTEDNGNIEADILYGGVYYGGGRRVISKTTSRSLKCCAVFLTPDEAEYVKTIVRSVVCDLYLGHDRNGNEIWIPANVEAGSFAKSERDNLQDFEITVEIPVANSQSL